MFQFSCINSKLFLYLSFFDLPKKPEFKNGNCEKHIAKQDFICDILADVEADY